MLTERLRTKVPGRFFEEGGTVVKKAMAVMLLVLLTAGCAAPKEPSYRQITMEEAVAMMAEEKEYIILDVRTELEYSLGHIPGAINVPNEEILNEPVPELPDKDGLIMVYCRSGNRSKQASTKLARLGYTNVVEFGGINDWPGEVAT